MITETLTGAFATTELVGRQKELETILGRIQDTANSRPCIIFLEGPGGIGKTRLLTEIIRRCKYLPGVKVSDPLIDAYHLRVHTPIEFMQDAYQSLTPLGSSFREYEKHARVLRNIRLSGEAVQVEEQVRAVQDAFVQGLKPFVQDTKQRVVILLDTLERFAYGADIPDVPDKAETWTWLVGQLKELPNVILVAAGRSEARPLLDGLDASVEVLPISLNTFSLEEAREYFQAAAATARHNSAAHTAKLLESLKPQEIEQAHELSGGRPILLALAADYVANGYPLQTLFDEARAAKDKTPQECFKDKILGRLLSLESLGQILRFMALAPKGVDAELLRILLDLPYSRIEQAEARLREIEKFSFVKHRSDPRHQTITYFLHDEIYDMLKAAAFSAPFAATTGRDEKNEIYKKIIDYYEERFKIVRRELGDEYTQIQAVGEKTVDWDEMEALLAQRSETLLALLYYRLRQDPPKGYRRWLRYDHEAVIGGDLEFALQLQLELSAYLRELADGREARDAAWDDDLVHWSLRLTSVKRAWARGENAKVLEEVQKIEEAFPNDVGDVLKKAMLVVWKAYALAFTQPQATPQEITHSIEALEALTQEKDEIRSWLAKMFLAFAYRVRAYALWTQERGDNAIADYRRAAVLLRDVDLKIEMATVHNDLGYMLMLMGEASDAQSLVKNALELRGEMGLGAQVAASLNTLGIIDTYEGRYNEAIENSTKSLNLARAVRNKRRIGLALLAVAESTHRQCLEQPEVDVNTRLDTLNRVFEMANEALAIFEESGETLRQVEALIEMGCARRDAVKLVNESKTSFYGTEKFLREGRQILERAAEVAGKLGEPSRVHPRQVDALVNLAWLGFYAGDTGNDFGSRAEQDAKRLLESYELPEGKSEPEIRDKPDYQPLLSAQLGKLYVLKGHRFYDEHREELVRRIKTEEDRRIVEKACDELAGYYFLALEHNAFYGVESRGLRLAKQQVFDRLKALRTENLQVFEEGLREWEKRHNLDGKSHLRQMLVKRALLLE
ncbi:MAG: tetratricopeptide repeat protein [Anaerolineales bacterium]